MKTLAHIIVTTFLLALLAGRAQAQTGGTQAAPKAGAPLEDVKPEDLATGDFGLDDVEELPLPTDEEGGVQVDGKNYIPKPVNAPTLETAPAPEPKQYAQPAPAPVQKAPAPVQPQQPEVVTPAPTAPEVPAVVPAPETPSETPAVAPLETAPEAPVTAEPQPAPEAPATAAPSEVPAPSAPAGTVAMLPSRLGAEGSPDIYSIVKGDNLWDICQRMFGDPFLWPRLWAMNQYITNPHLIYPGDQLRFFMGTATTAPHLEIAKENAPQAASSELAQAPAAMDAPSVPPPAPGEEKLDSAPVAETASATAPADALLEPSSKAPGTMEVKNYSFLPPKEYDAAGRIRNSAEEKELLSTGDTVYLQFEDPKSVHEGDMFYTMQTLKAVKHPKNRKTLGYLIKYKARIRVVKIEEKTITGIIDDSWDLSSREDRIVAASPLIRQVMPKENEKKVEGLIIESANELYMISQHDIAFVNVGKGQGIEAGDKLMVVQQGDGVFGKTEGLPDVAIGQLTVVEPLDDVAIVIVNWSNKSLEIGDRVTTRL